MRPPRLPSDFLGEFHGSSVTTTAQMPYVAREFTCATCKMYLFGIVHYEKHDADFIFPLKVKCQDGAHVLQVRELVGQEYELPGVLVKSMTLSRQQAIAYVYSHMTPLEVSKLSPALKSELGLKP